MSLLTNFGQFEHAAELSVLFDRDMTKLFQAMAVHCMREQGSYVEVVQLCYLVHSHVHAQLCRI